MRRSRSRPLRSICAERFLLARGERAEDLRQQELGVTEHDVERRAQLVRDRRHELRFEPVGARQRFDELVLLLLGALAARDLDDRALVVEQVSLGVAHGAGVLRDPDDGAVGTAYLRLESTHRVVLLEQAAELVTPLRIDVEAAGNVGQAGDQRRRRRVAVDAGERRVGAEVAAVGRRLEDALDGVLVDAAIAVLGATQRGLGLAPLAQVAQVDEHDVAPFPGGQRSSHVHGAGRAVDPPHLAFDDHRRMLADQIEQVARRAVAVPGQRLGKQPPNQASRLATENAADAVVGFQDASVRLVDHQHDVRLMAEDGLEQSITLRGSLFLDRRWEVAVCRRNAQLADRRVLHPVRTECKFSADATPTKLGSRRPSPSAREACLVRKSTNERHVRDVRFRLPTLRAAALPGVTSRLDDESEELDGDGTFAGGPAEQRIDAELQGGHVVRRCVDLFRKSCTKSLLLRTKGERRKPSRANGATMRTWPSHG